MATSHPTTTTSSSMTSTSFFLVFLLYRGVGQKTIFINFLIFFLTGFYWVSIWVSLTHYRVLLGFPYGFLCRVPSFTGFLIDVMGEKTVFTGFYWVSIWISFNYRVLLGFHLDFIRLLGFTGFPFRFRCRLPSFTGFPFGFHSITGFYWVSVQVSLPITEFYWVSFCYRRENSFYRVLLGFHLDFVRLPGLTGLIFGFLSPITGFYWVSFLCAGMERKQVFLPGFTGFLPLGSISFHYPSIILIPLFCYSSLSFL